MNAGPQSKRGRAGPPVAVIGGGWAGCAAAWALASRGVPVVLHEAAGVLGGRARRVERAGLPIDNGQHLLVGAYEATRSLLRNVHGGRVDPGLDRQPLEVVPFARDAAAVRLRALRLPPPWNLAADHRDRRSGAGALRLGTRVHGQAARAVRHAIHSLRSGVRAILRSSTR